MCKTSKGGNVKKGGSKRKIGGQPLLPTVCQFCPQDIQKSDIYLFTLPAFLATTLKMPIANPNIQILRVYLIFLIATHVITRLLCSEIYPP